MVLYSRLILVLGGIALTEITKGGDMLSVTTVDVIPMDFLKLLQKHFPCGKWVDVRRLVTSGEHERLETVLREVSEHLYDAWIDVKTSLSN